MSNIPPFLVYDIEANGLFNDPWKDNATHIWCAVFLDQDKNETIFVRDDLVDECSYDVLPLSELKQWLGEQVRAVQALICHNQIGYDLRMFEKFLDIGYSIKPDRILGHKVEIIDTLLDSKWLNPKRPLPYGCPGAIWPEDGGKSKIIGPHGLEAWGYRVAKKKPSIEDWENLHIDEYVQRCIEDVHINWGTFRLLNQEIAHYFKGIDELTQWKENRKKAKWPIYIEHAFKADIVEQEDNGVPFNREKAEALILKFDAELAELKERIEAHLPKIPIPPSRLQHWKFPAKPFKKDGSPAAALEKFCKKWHGTYYKNEEGNWEVEILVENEKRKYTTPFPDYLKTHEQMAVESEHLPQYIIDEYGWVPMYWNYKIDPKSKKKMRDDDNNLIPTTPRLKDAQSGRICPNLQGLEVPFIKDIIRYRTVKHRRQTIKSFKDETKGFLNHPRLEIDGKIPAGMDTIGAATSRCTHKGVCNIPKADEDVIYGAEMRSLFWNGGDPDWFFLTYDASQLENRIEGSEAAAYDGGEYANILLNSDIHQTRADLFGIKRQSAKNVAYALLYGAGKAKIAQMLNISEEEATTLLEDWWEEYWASKKAIDRLKKEHKATGSRYIRGIDGRPIHFTSPHLCMNYRIQNAGTTIIKLHECLMRQKTAQYRKENKAQKLISMHDENSYLVHKSIVKWKKCKSKEEAFFYHENKNCALPKEKDGVWYVAYCPIGKLGVEAIKEAGDLLGLRVELTGVYQIDRDWSGTH